MTPTPVTSSGSGSSGERESDLEGLLPSLNLLSRGSLDSVVIKRHHAEAILSRLSAQASGGGNEVLRALVNWVTGDGEIPVEFGDDDRAMERYGDKVITDARAAIASRALAAPSASDEVERLARHLALEHVRANDAEADYDWDQSEPAWKKSFLAKAKTYLDAAAPSASDEVPYTQAELDEYGQIGEREGYEQAVQDIDRLTGGDGEYKVAIDLATGAADVVDVEAMKARIVQRFEEVAAAPRFDDRAGMMRAVQHEISRLRGCLYNIANFNRSRDQLQKMAKEELDKPALPLAAAAEHPRDDGWRPLVFVYRNYRNKVTWRRVQPISVRWGSTEWHPDPQWLLLAHDLDKNADRESALSDIAAKDEQS